jgi:hypothetical protein
MVMSGGAGPSVPSVVVLPPDPAPKQPRDPVSAKVSNGGLVGVAGLLITWGLTYFIPAWHSGIPPALAGIIPGALSVAGYLLGGYFSKHQATLREVTAALLFAEKVKAAAGPKPSLVFNRPVAPPSGAPSPGQTSPGGGASADG